jgi:hypothetical protein
MPIQYAHPILTLQPVNPEHISHLDYRQVLFHNDHPYEPPTYGDIYDYVPVDLDALTTWVQGATKRHNLKSPTAYRWHHRLGCASHGIIDATKSATTGMVIQQGSLAALPSLLPCEACI